MNQILVIEDEPDILTLIHKILTANGFEVIRASTGEEGLVLASKLNPDLIILDIVMPGLSGLEVLRLLKSKKTTKEVPVIIVSALNRDIDRQYANDYGADAYIAKPFNIHDILTEVDRLMG